MDYTVLVSGRGQGLVPIVPSMNPMNVSEGPAYRPGENIDYGRQGEKVLKAIPVTYAGDDSFAPEVKVVDGFDRGRASYSGKSLVGLIKELDSDKNPERN